MAKRQRAESSQITCLFCMVTTYPNRTSKRLGFPVCEGCEDTAKNLLKSGDIEDAITAAGAHRDDFTVGRSRADIEALDERSDEYMNRHKSRSGRASEYNSNNRSDDYYDDVDTNLPADAGAVRSLHNHFDRIWKGL